MQCYTTSWVTFGSLFVVVHLRSCVLVKLAEHFAALSFSYNLEWSFSYAKRQRLFQIRKVALSFIEPKANSFHCLSIVLHYYFSFYRCFWFGYVSNSFWQLRSLWALFCREGPRLSMQWKYLYRFIVRIMSHFNSLRGLKHNRIRQTPNKYEAIFN